MRKDLIGNVFGKLTVCQLDEERTKNGKVYWLCQCECGNTTSVLSTALTRKNGNTTSCGCNRNSKEAIQKSNATKIKYPNGLVGMKFGRLKVLEETDKISDKSYDNGSVLWKCQCECGNIVYYSRYKLISETSGVKSCGCYYIDKLSERSENLYDLQYECGIGYCENGTKFYFDLEDYDLIKSYKWNYDGRYVQTHDKEDKSKLIRMHRLVLGLKQGDNVNVDHINHCTFDNRKTNLRLANDFENARNKKNCACTEVNSIGIHKNANGKYIVNFMHNYIGTYDNYKEAFNVRTSLEKEIYKDFQYNPKNDYYNNK